MRLPTADDWFSGERKAKLSIEQAGFRGSATADLTLTDDEPMPQLSLSDAADVYEGGPGETRAAEFEITLSGPIGAPLPVGLATLPGTASATDYIAVTAAQIPPGVTSVRVPVAIRGDSEPERDESFTLAVTSCCEGFATVARGTATAVIRNDDAASRRCMQSQRRRRFTKRRDGTT